jgi:hypothetical protein
MGTALDRQPNAIHRSVHLLLYGNDSDWFERWLNEEVEQPAAAVLAKVRPDEELDPAEWHRLAKYAASLDLRTPPSYVEQSERWSREVPETLQRTMANLENTVREAIRTGEIKKFAS